MNEADFPSINLDELRLVPDWMREGAPDPSKKYAQHQGGDDRERRPQGRSPGGLGGPRRDNGGGPRRDGSGDRRGPRSGGSGGSGGGPGERRDSRGPGARDGGRRDDRRGGAPDSRPPREFAAPATPPKPAPVQVVFQPDDRCMTSIVKQIRSTHLAYPLFSLARMFLQEPARHWVQFTVEPTAAQTGTQLFQIGDEGPIAFERSVLEPIAYDSAREQFYREETVQKDPIKGNFANVARERTTGTLLGPTNYHAYQPALRALYDARFSRRMSFEDFRRGIEIVSDPAVVERWKEEARTVTTIVTKDVEPPTVLNTPAEARAHFRQHHLETLVKSGTTRRAHGSVARTLPDQSLMQAIREAHEREVRYPAQFVQLLREGLQAAGLHIFKHRKRVVYVSLSRPVPFIPGSGVVSPTVATILDIIGKNPLCTRKFIAGQVLGKSTDTLESIPAAKDAAAPAAASETPAPDAAAALVGEEPLPVSSPEITEISESPAAPVANDGGTPTESALPDVSSAASATAEAPKAAMTEPTPAAPLSEAAKAKAALASDLRFLVQAGHIIEFHNGTFDLPLLPKAKEEPAVKPGTPAAKSNHAVDTEEIGADPVEFANPPGTPAEAKSFEPQSATALSDGPPNAEPAIEIAPEPTALAVDTPFTAEAEEPTTAAAVRERAALGA